MERQSEIVQEKVLFLPGADIKMSMVICVWNTSHLLKRSIETYCKQTLPTVLWELIVIDDNSEDNVLEAIDFAWGKINMTYIRLEHKFGMRGNTVGFNTGFKRGKGFLISESTPETCLPRTMLQRLYEPHLKEDRAFVAAKTYNLTQDVQEQIDTVDWREDVSNCMHLPGFFNDWTLNNFKNTHFGTHQTCSIKKEVFLELFPNGYFLYGDYGSEDCNFCGRREQFRVKDITIMQPMAIHQWHPPYHYWMSKGKAPNANRWGHSMSNYLGDTSGEVPEGGTCMIWDGGSHEQQSEAEIADWASWDERVRKTGCKLV